MKLTVGEGYLRADDRCSGGKLIQQALLGCMHCQATIPKEDWKAGKTGAYCPQCDWSICTICAIRYKKFGCEVFERRFTAMIEDNYRKQQNAKILGI